MTRLAAISWARRRSAKTPAIFILPTLLLAMVVVASAAAQQKPSDAKPEPRPRQTEPQEQKKEDGRYHFGAELAKETREAAGEDDTAEFKQSASVRFLARVTGLSLQNAYWLAVVLNFAVIAGAFVWVAKKFLPGVFSDRTLAIQKAMEEARKASAEANQRLSEIESRLARLDAEISEMRTAAEREAEAEGLRILAAAEEDKHKIIESAQQEIAAAAKQARRELAAHAADLAVALAAKQIHLDAASDQALVHSFAQNLANGDSKKGTS